ncbi:MAG: triose-phosphate isomerase [Victivallaceae bacterium]
MSRKNYILGNWKMHKTCLESVAFFDEFVSLMQEHLFPGYIGIAVPFTALSLTADLASSGRVLPGAQNVSSEEQGAFTGEISSCMLKEAGAEFVIVGHSERRILFGETDFIVSLKIRRVLLAGMLPVFCIGETAEERQQNLTKNVLRRQITDGLSKVDIGNDFVLAYEPVWAIGTGNVPENEEIENIHQFIRQVLGEVMAPEKAAGISVLYGGSVNATNISEISVLPNIDGVLVGGASLSPVSFFEIVSNYSSI